MLIFTWSLCPSSEGYYTDYTVVYICGKYYREKIEILKADDPDSYSKVKTDDFKMTQKGECTHGRAGMSSTDNHPRTLLNVPALEYW